LLALARLSLANARFIFGCEAGKAKPFRTSSGEAAQDVSDCGSGLIDNRLTASSRHRPQFLFD
jgi:hypothetical protein